MNKNSLKVFQSTVVDLSFVTHFEHRYLMKLPGASLLTSGSSYNVRKYHNNKFICSKQHWTIIIILRKHNILTVIINCAGLLFYYWSNYLLRYTYRSTLWLLSAATDCGFFTDVNHGYLFVLGYLLCRTLQKGKTQLHTQPNKTLDTIIFQRIVLAIKP